MWLLSEPSGPIEKGTTYIVRPFIDPLKRSFNVSRISAGSRQLLVGPASSSRSEQMKVRSSTRATSAGSERARYELGRFASSRRSKVPASIRTWARRSYSSAEPSHQWIESGSVRAAISPTHCFSLALVVSSEGAVVRSLIRLSLFLAFEADHGDVGIFVADLQARYFPPVIRKNHVAGERRPRLHGLI